MKRKGKSHRKEMKRHHKRGRKMMRMHDESKEKEGGNPGGGY
jgi:hypothetical protein